MQVQHYLTPDGRDPFDRWLDRIRDRRAMVAIERRIARIERDGYLGDHKYLRDGVSELRIDEGAGYRVYYAQIEQVVVLLLCGGDKSTQDGDINRAVANWEEFQRRRKGGGQGMTSKLTRSHEEATIERFRKDPEFAAEYLDAILKDGDEAELLQALQRFSKSFGGVAEIAERAELNAKSLYRALSAQGNPEMKTLVAILKAMGMRLSVKPIEDTRISA